MGGLDLTSILMTIVVGGICGWIASLIMKSKKRLLGNIIIGIIGGVLGGWLWGIIQTYLNGFLGTIVWGVVGSCILLALAKAIFKK